MRYKVLFAFIISIFVAASVTTQDTPPDLTLAKGYLLGPGDQVTATIGGERDYDFVATIDEDGNIEVPFSNKPIAAKCMTERQLRIEVTKLLERELREPRVNLRVTDRKSRPPATVYGEVTNPGRIEMMRKATLVEVLAFVGGVRQDEAGGLVQIFRTQPPICGAMDDKDNWRSDSSDPTVVPSRTFSLAKITQGTEGSNPVVYPGDVVYVHRAALVSITGEVVAPQSIFLKDSGLSLTQAIAKVGGVRREAKTKDITVRRLKAGTNDQYDIISANYDLIRKGKQKDVMLQPYDIVEVNQSKDSVAMQVLKIAIGAGKSGVNAVTSGAGYRVLY